jgi:DNA repair exonuclease SbcCD ATPase subunit
MNSQLNRLLEIQLAHLNKAEFYKELLADTRTNLDLAEQAYRDALKAREVINIVAKETQQQLEMRITNIVTMALAAVFPDPYEFKLVFNERRNQTEADLLLVRDGEELSPVEGAGGGVLDVVSFALRIAVLLMSNHRRIIILDEPFRHLSADLQPKASEMMKMLSDKLGIQFIMVSHEEGIIDCADNIITIKKGQTV